MQLAHFWKFSSAPSGSQNNVLWAIGMADILRKLDRTLEFSLSQDQQGYMLYLISFNWEQIMRFSKYQHFCSSFKKKAKPWNSASPNFFNCKILLLYIQFN